MTKRQLAAGTEVVVPLNPNSLGGTTHQFNPVGGSMVVSADTAKFNDWKRVPPRVLSSKGEGGYGEEIGLKAPRSVTNPCTGGVKLVLTPGPGTGNPVTFDGTSLEKTILQANFSNNRCHPPRNRL